MVAIFLNEHLSLLAPKLGKSQREKMQRVKTSENFAEERMFAEDNSEDFSVGRRTNR